MNPSDMQACFHGLKIVLEASGAVYGVFLLVLA